jgi:hypothetical protein
VIGYTPTTGDLPAKYDGTLRVEASSERMVASGDLYARKFDFDAVDFFPGPEPQAGIPILPIDSYRYYLRVTRISDTGSGFSLAFEALRFSAEPVQLLDGSNSRWLMEGALTAMMAPELAPAGFPSPELYFGGDVANAAGATIGRLTMGFVSPFLRKATVEIDRVPVAELPLDNGAGASWRTILNKLGWDISVFVSDSNVEEPSGESWNRAEAHAAMEVKREQTDLNAEWRYHVLAVRRIDKQNPASATQFELLNGERGFMYDEGGRLPREGFMVASHWLLPDEEAWGLVRGMRAGTTVTYFRTAVHEMGHAMGLEHNDADNGFMNTTEIIAENSLEASATPFPKNILWSFASDDEHRLRHWPDLIVRPGGRGPKAGESSPVSPFESDRHKLNVTPVLPAVPLGAPVRINLSLINVTDKAVDSPSSLSLNSGFVRGHVVDPSGAVRTFSPLALNESQATRDLAPGKAIEDGLTLFQGRQGELFPMPGAYRIVVEVTWRGRAEDVKNKLTFIVSGAASITVTAAVDGHHAEAAHRVLKTADVLLTVALGGDHLKEGIEAIRTALKNDVLRPHFAYIEAKRLATRFFKRKPDLKAAADLIDETTVMSPAEFRKAVRMVESDGKSAGAAAMAAKLKARIAGSEVDEDLRAMVRRL